jgi:hypothetical protein
MTKTTERTFTAMTTTQIAMNCGRCHECDTPLAVVLDGEEWCRSCETYRRYASHGWVSPPLGDDSPCPRNVGTDAARRGANRPICPAVQAAYDAACSRDEEARRPRHRRGEEARRREWVQALTSRARTTRMHRRDISIAPADGHTGTVRALVYRDLAAHRQRRGPRWVITHVASGRAVVRVDLSATEVRVLLIRLAEAANWTRPAAELASDQRLKRLVKQLSEDPFTDDYDEDAHGTREAD